MQRSKYGVTIMLIVCFGIYPILASAVDVQDAKIKKDVLIRAEWGDGRGEIGEVPEASDKTASESINPIAIDSNNNIYIGDSINYRVLKFDSNGKYLSEINLRQYDEWPYKNIPDIIIDSNNNVYIALLRKQKIVKYNSAGKQVSLFDLSKAGVLKKNKDGLVKVDTKSIFNMSKLVLDKSGNIYVLGSEQNILKLDSKGEITQRWGPYASNALNFLFIDSQNNLYVWMPPGKDGSMFKRYDHTGKFVGNGLGIYDQIIEPFYSDSSGNVYGFTSFTDNVLAIYNNGCEKLLKLPIKQESLAFERWTVSPMGNIYYTNTAGNFELIKITVSPGDK